MVPLISDFMYKHRTFHSDYTFISIQTSDKESSLPETENLQNLQ